MARRPRSLLARLRSRATREAVRVGYFTGPRIASELRKWWVVTRNPQATIIFGKGTHLGPGFSLHCPHGGTFITGEYVEFRRGFRAEMGGPETRIEFGAYSVCTYDVLMQIGTTFIAGERAMLGQCVLVVDGNHNFKDLDRPMLAQGYEFSPVRLGDDAVVTTKSTVIGAEIGTRAFIGANTVVTRPIPPYCVAVGAPARVVDYFGPPECRPAELSGPNSDRSG